MKSHQVSIKSSSDTQLLALEKDMLAKLGLIGKLEAQIARSTMDFKELEEKLMVITKEKDFNSTQNKELNHLLTEAKSKIRELEEKLANIPKPPVEKPKEKEPPSPTKGSPAKPGDQ